MIKTKQKAPRASKAPKAREVRRPSYYPDSDDSDYGRNYGGFSNDAIDELNAIDDTSNRRWASRPSFSARTKASQTDAI